MRLPRFCRLFYQTSRPGGRLCPPPGLLAYSVGGSSWRATLSRREVAIRDFYDIDYLIQRLGIRATATELIRMVRAKLAVLGNEQIDVTEFPMGALRNQLDAQLKPVLRDTDFAAFDLNRAIDAVAEMARRIV